MRSPVPPKSREAPGNVEDSVCAYMAFVAHVKDGTEVSSLLTSPPPGIHLRGSHIALFAYRTHSFNTATKLPCYKYDTPPLHLSPTMQPFLDSPALHPPLPAALSPSTTTDGPLLSPSTAAPTSRLSAAADASRVSAQATY